MSDTNKPVNFYETSSEDKAKNPSAYGITEGGIVFVKGDKDGKIYRDGKPFGGGGGDDPFPSTAESVGITVGGLSSGDSVADKTPKEVIEAMIYPEYAPYFVDATASITCRVGGSTTNTGSVKEVGTSTPKTSEYFISGTQAKAIGNGTYIATNGEANVSKSQSISSTLLPDSVLKQGYKFESYETTTNKAGYICVRCSSECAVGSSTTGAVKTNKGNNTNKTGGSAESRTLLKSAKANTTNLTTTDSNGNTYVKATTKYAYHVIYYRYYIYASKEQAGVLSAMPLSTATTVRLALVGGASGQKFAIPKSYTLTSIKEKDPFTGQYTLDALDSYSVSEDNTTYSVAYKVYTRKKINDATTDLDITFSIG